MDIFLSTGGFGNRPGFETAVAYREAGISEIEMSGGMYQHHQLEKLAALAGTKLQLHNYFPPPVTPFVFNLASRDPQILAQSMELAKQAIVFTAENACPAYGFHGGFLFDPKPSQLGGKLDLEQLFDRAISFAAFVENVNILADFAGRHDVKLLIENNVLSERNFQVFGGNPLLLVEPNEMETFAKCMPANVKLLIDVAHLKVSSHTIGFDMVKGLRQLWDHTDAYHLSDNDGVEDTNGVIHEESWFWNHLNPTVRNYTVEVYSPDINVLHEQVILVGNHVR